MIAAFMQTELPDHIDPWQLAAAAGRLEGTLMLSGLPRLRELLHAATGSVMVNLEAGVDERGVHFIGGRAVTSLELICQRCLEPLSLPLDIPFRLGLIHSESDADDLPDEYEPLLVAKADLVSADLVEDELILALPLIALHQDAAECRAQGFSAPEPLPARHPFGVLASLLNPSKTE
jgi:uncharacterized protein